VPSLRWPVLLLLLALTACGGSRKPPAVPAVGANASQARLAGVPIVQLTESPELCHFVMAHAGITYRPVADKREGAGCYLKDTIALSPDSLPLDREATTTCALGAGVVVFERTIVEPAALRHFGVPLKEMVQWGTYACRTRNSRAGAPISEHATANAIDIGAFVLADGRKVTVLDGWDGSSAERAFLREVHDGACGIFHGVIGPEGDAQHRNHFHLDMGAWRFCQ